MSWDAQIEVLKLQYKALKPREREIRDEENAEARRRADVRIREVRQVLADDFKRYREAGMPQYAIQEVLGTKDWNTLRQWRELMNVASPREIRAAQIAEASPFRWARDYSTLTAIRSIEGVDLETPVEYDMSTNRLIGGFYWPDSVVESAERAAWEVDGLPAWKRHLHAEIEAQIKAGNVPAPNESENGN